MSDIAAACAWHDRDAALCNYVPLVRQVARRVSAHLPRLLDHEDMVGYGTIALIEAFDRYDGARGVPFAAFAAQRIRGAIIDAHRAYDPLSRPAREQARRFEQARDRLRAELGREPGESEVAGAAGTAGALAAALSAGARRDPVSLTVLQEQRADWEPAEPGDAPEEAALRRHLREALAAALAELPRRELLLLSLYYRDELSMSEVARVMGISLARVSQLHARAVRRLRSTLATWSG